jgi:hypothetical protein
LKSEVQLLVCKSNLIWGRRRVTRTRLTKWCEWWRGTSLCSSVLHSMV